MLEAYTQIHLFYGLLFIFVIFSTVKIFIKQNEYINSVVSNQIMTILLLLYCILFIGYRQWWVEDAFGDSVRYGKSYLLMVRSYFSEAKDLGFALFTYICRRLNITITLYFVICAFIYVYPLYLSTIKISRKFSFILLLSIVVSFSFYSYGVNGMRNGISTSLLMLAFVKHKNRIQSFTLCLIAALFHLSALLPIIAYILTLSYKNTKVYLSIWFISVPLSYYFIPLKGLMHLNIFMNRFNSYLSSEVSMDKFTKTGFRWDFIIYSSIPVFIGMYYVHIKKVYDEFYSLILCIYLIVNTIWVIINDVAFSNRFAYLSWFMIPIVLIYPLTKNVIIKNRSLKISLVVLMNYIFTYYMYITK